MKWPWQKPEDHNTALRHVAWSRTVRYCWTCEASVNEHTARTEDTGWGIIEGTGYQFWECPVCAEEGPDEALLVVEPASAEERSAAEA